MARGSSVTAPEAMDPVDLVDGLTRLVDRSLVIVERGTTTRYRMLETIRQYAREKLIEADEAADLADRHLAVYWALAAEAQEPTPRPGDGRLARPPRRGARQSGCRPGMGPRGGTVDAAQMCLRAPRLLGGPRHVPGQRCPDRRRDRDRQDAGHGPARRRPAPTRRSAARLLGEAARLWAMSGRGIQALGWAEEAVALADASGDAAARLGGHRRPSVATVFAGRAGPGGVAVRQIFERRSTWRSRAASGGRGDGRGVRRAPASSIRSGGGAALLQRGMEAARRSGSPYAIGVVAMAQGRTLGRTGQTMMRSLPSAWRSRASWSSATPVRPREPERPGPRPAARRTARRGHGDVPRDDRRLGPPGHRGGDREPAREHRIHGDGTGSFNRAARLLGAADALREASGSPGWPMTRSQSSPRTSSGCERR